MDAPARRRPKFPWTAVAILVAVAGAGAWLLLRDGATAGSASPTWVVRRGPLEVTVSEGGSVQALKTTLVASKVEGDAKILTIVPEGTVLTAEDVTNGRVLVELDASDLRNRINRQQIAVAQAEAAREHSKAAVSIQTDLNASALRKADLDVQFTRLDLEKYLGAGVAGKAIAAREAMAAADPQAAASAVDLRPLAADPDLGGEALQAARKFQSDIDLANEELTRARDKLTWTEKLLEKGYVSQDEAVADRLAVKRQEVAVDQAKTAKDLFERYAFGKQVATLLSALVEAGDARHRTASKASSAINDLQADLRGNEDRLKLEKALMEKLNAQERSCTIRAEGPGLVVYASSEDRGGWMGDQSPIQVGTTIHERQSILSIPDPLSMGVRVKVHESALDKVKVGQRARVRVESMPDRPLVGSVVRMATLPDTSNRWQNPDLKVYATDIALDEAPADLRQQVSARVEIRIEEIPSTLSVPSPAVVFAKGRPTVWVRTDAGDVPRSVTLGANNDRMVEIKEGLAEGDVVLLSPPRETGGGAGEGGKEGKDKADGGKPGAGKPGRGGPGAPRAAPGAGAGTPSAGGGAAGTPHTTPTGSGG